MIKFGCQGCGKRMGVADPLGGRRTKCPRCGATVQIPRASAPPPAVAMKQEPTDYDVRVDGDEAHADARSKKRPAPARGAARALAPASELLAKSKPLVAAVAGAVILAVVGLVIVLTRGGDEKTQQTNVTSGSSAPPTVAEVEPVEITPQNFSSLVEGQRYLICAEFENRVEEWFMFKYGPWHVAARPTADLKGRLRPPYGYWIEGTFSGFRAFRTVLGVEEDNPCLVDAVVMTHQQLEARKLERLRAKDPELAEFVEQVEGAVKEGARGHDALVCDLENFNSPRRSKAMSIHTDADNLLLEAQRGCHANGFDEARKRVQEARSKLQEVIDIYPDTPAAAEAKKLIELLPPATAKEKEELQAKEREERERTEAQATRLVEEAHRLEQEGNYEGALDQYMEALKLKEDAEVRAAATRLSERVGAERQKKRTRESIARFHKEYEAAGADPQRQANAVGTLRDALAAPETIAELCRLLARPAEGEGVRANAAGLLAASGTPEALSALKEAVNATHNGDIGDDIIRAVGNIGTKDSRDLLESVVAASIAKPEDDRAQALVWFALQELVEGKSEDSLDRLMRLYGALAALRPKNDAQKQYQKEMAGKFKGALGQFKDGEWFDTYDDWKQWFETRRGIASPGPQAADPGSLPDPGVKPPVPDPNAGTPEDPAVAKPCPDCGGQGSVQCTKCEDGEVESKCPKCKEGKVKCATCKGTGKGACSCNGDPKCGLCGGTGKYFCDDCTSGNKTCPKCDGARKVVEKCPECKGSERAPCRACEGTGKFTTPEEKEAQSLLRQAGMHATAGRFDAARQKYQEILDKYPGTRAAAEARKLIERLPPAR